MNYKLINNGINKFGDQIIEVMNLKTYEVEHHMFHEGSYVSVMEFIYNLNNKE